MFLGSVQKISRANIQSKFQMFTLFTGRHILVDQGGPPTWLLRTKLYKNFLRGTFRRISQLWAKAHI